MDAIERLTRKLALQPDDIHARSELAMALATGRGDLASAEAHARELVRLAPNDPVAQLTVAKIRGLAGRHAEAADALRIVLAHRPDDVQALYGLGMTCHATGAYNESKAAFYRLIGLQPTNKNWYVILSAIQRDAGRADDAIETLRNGLRVGGPDAAVHANLISLLLYHPQITAERFLDETRAWSRAYAEPLAAEIEPHRTTRDASRPLRVGYVSPFFREHSVGFFIEPILQHHDRERFDVVLYNDARTSDAVTARMRGYPGLVWRETVGLDDRSLAQHVRADRIDILVDLTQHLRHSRLLAFARKPAPVQVSYLGYPGTTGLSTIDYRLGDALLDPPGTEAEPFGTETIARLPETYFCYRAPDDAPPVIDQPPCERNGYVTFASHHVLMKLNDRCVGAWARLLVESPNARLLIKAQGVASDEARQRLLATFAAHGVGAERIGFVPFSSLRRAMEEMTADADVALDAFPYSAGTTTCHTLWSGVPVVTLAGALPFQRMGYSVLHQVGLDDLVARDVDEYVAVASSLARDVDRLRELRRSLRDRMRGSPLMQGQRFTRALEELYRGMWSTWVRRGA